MRKHTMLMLLGIAVAGGCAAGTNSSPAAVSTATAAGSQPTTQTGDSQDRDARIKESDAVRRSMGY